MDRGTEKGALAFEAHRRYTVEEKARLLATLEAAQRCTDQPIEAVVEQLGLAVAMSYRWQTRAEVQRLEDQVVVPAEPAYRRCRTRSRSTGASTRRCWLTPSH